MGRYSLETLQMMAFIARIGNRGKRDRLLSWVGSRGRRL